VTHLYGCSALDNHVKRHTSGSICPDEEDEEKRRPSVLLMDCRAPVRINLNRSVLMSQTSSGKH